jgi:4-hydroxybenzoate polyprenyltransferase
MSSPGKLFRFFIYSNLFIALCAVLMVYQTCKLLLQTTPDIYFTSFVFFATICSYSFHWYLTPIDTETPSTRMDWLNRNRNVHGILFFIGLAGAGICCLFLLDYWLWLLLSAFITFLYSAPKIPHPYFRQLRKVALGKTIFLALVWMHVTTILPLLISNQPWKPVFTLFAFSRFFLVYAICILFDYRDREYDRKVGIKSLITWLNETEINTLFVLSLLVFSVFVVWMLPFGQSFETVIILLMPGAITAALYRHARKKFSDILYYFVLDGLMALSALLSLLFGR